MSSLQEIQINLTTYKKKFYKRQILIGVLIFLATSLSLFLALSFLEYQFWMNSFSRSVLFYFFLIFILGGLILLIIRPLIKFIDVDRSIDDLRAADEISKYFPEVEDRLINLLELGSQNEKHNELINAAIDKKASSLTRIQFSQAVNFSVAKKYLIGTMVVIGCFFLVSFINPEMINESPKRIANYTREYEKASPFQLIS